jgi:hypothetical protein
MQHAAADNWQVMVTHIISQEPLISEGKRPLLRQLLQRLVDKQLEPQASHFDLFKVGGRGTA